MTKPDRVAPEAKDDVVSPSWGTWEELILAFAVNRHGTASWDSIASELQKRTSDPNLSLTAHHCRLKYLDLKRRFVADVDGGGKSSVEESAAPLLEELRKLRVAELRREVQRYDLNIESLELRVKSLEEEQEGSEGREKSESDLENKSEEEKRDAEPEAGPARGGEPVVGDDLEKDQLSVNESNSTDPEVEKARTSEKESEPDGTVAEEEMQDRTGKTSEEPAEEKPEPDRKSVRADSCNGSSNSIEKSEERKVKDEPVTDSVESESESDGGGETAKENSDVQSTASRSRKEEGSDKVRRGNTSGDEREHEDQSRAVKELSAESQPLFDFLQAIRAHKFGSNFERRLRSQETSKYQKLILQHIDLETVETKLREAWYGGSRIKFFRDLLLLVNNALVFFGKKSAEANAANELRLLISKEMSNKNKKAKSDSSSGKQVSLKSLSMSKKEKDEPSPSNSLMLKPRLSGSLIVCRKRSSIASKSSTPSSDKKKETISSSPPNEKDSKKLLVDFEEPKITKKRTRDNLFSSSAPSNTKKNSKNNNITKQQQQKQQQQQQQQGKGGGSSSEPPKSDNKKSQTGSDSKKRGAASFLNRMKQGSLSSNNNNNNNNNGDLLDVLKNMPLTNEVSASAGKGGGSEQKKSENVKRGEKKEQATRRSTTETRQTKEKEKGSPGKKNVGRPPKRGAAPPPLPPPAAAVSKRGRERSETETPPGKQQQPKKRQRKL